MFSPDSIFPRTMGPMRTGGTFQKCRIQLEEEMAGKENSEKFSECDADSGNGARLNDQKERPAVKKSPERPQRFSKIDVLPAGPRHHGCQFAIAESADNGQKSGYQPGADQQRRRIDFAAKFPPKR